MFTHKLRLKNWATHISVLLFFLLYLGTAVSQEVSDVSGNTYNTEIIGTQEWMAINLRTTQLRDGTSIPEVTEASAWDSLKTPAFCWYNNDTTGSHTCGALYNWYAVNTDLLCPEGWHVASANDWDTLVAYLDGQYLAGGRLKEIGFANWKKPNTGATNEVRFSALPAGIRHFGEGFSNKTTSTYFWTATEFNEDKAGTRILIYYSNNIYRDNNNKTNGYSVRCIKD